MIRKLYQHLASSVDARLHCLPNGEHGSQEWAVRHADVIAQLARDCLPSGSGVDNGTTVDLDRSTGEKLILHTAFHHMDEQGYYSGWTDHMVTVRASLVFGLSLTVSGPDRNDIKTYLYDLFHESLTCDVEHTYNPETKENAFRMVARV